MRAHLLINRIENLEPRLLLASFASLNAAGVLSVVGNSNNNVINVVYSLDKVKVTRDGSNLYFDQTKVKKIWAEGFGGNDKITIGVPLPATLIGDAGNDTLVGNAKDDELHGGSGDDRLSGGDGSNIIDHGSGNDVIDYSAMHSGEFFLAEAGLAHPGTGVDVVGNSRATVLLTPGSDRFFAAVPFELNCDLIIDGGAGNDQFWVGGSPFAYVYRINGGAGNDTFTWTDEGGAFGYVSGGPGNDVFNYNDAVEGPRPCDGGSGYDSYNLDFHFEFRGDYDVTVPPGIEAFSAATDTSLIIRGNALDNDLTAGTANVTIYGNGGNDRLHVNADPFSPWRDDPGHGFADGGSGNDRLIGSIATVFKGGSGNDTADFSARTDNLKVSLDNVANDGAAGENANVLADVENITGGSGNDRLIGNPFANLLKGGAGNDTLYGGAGNDTLDGGGGRDLMFGQDGNDRLLAKDNRTDSLDGGNGFDTAQRDNSSTIKDSVLNIESFI